MISNCFSHYVFRNTRIVISCASTYGKRWFSICIPIIQTHRFAPLRIFIKVIAADLYSDHLSRWGYYISRQTIDSCNLLIWVHASTRCLPWRWKPSHRFAVEYWYSTHDRNKKTLFPNNNNQFAFLCYD